MFGLAAQRAPLEPRLRGCTGGATSAPSGTDRATLGVRAAMSESEPRSIREPIEPIRQPYHYPRGPEIRAPGDVLWRNLSIALCIMIACALVVMLYFIAQGRFL